jgi:hypothetical protein
VKQEFHIVLTFINDVDYTVDGVQEETMLGIALAER